MIQSIKYTYKGMNQDVAKSKHPFEFYFKGRNIRMISTESQTSGAITNEKGNSLSLAIPNVKIDTASKIIEYGVYDSINDLIINPKTLSYNNDEINTAISNETLSELSTSQRIIGYGLTRDSILLFSTDGTTSPLIPAVPEKANLLRWSEQPSNVVWLKSNSNIIEDDISFPYGGYSGDRYESINTGGFTRNPLMSQTLAKAASIITYTVSFYGKIGDLRQVEIKAFNLTKTAGFTAKFDMFDGFTGNDSEVGFTIISTNTTDEGDNWRRHDVKFTTDNDSGLIIELEILKDGFGNGFPSVGGEGLYIRGIQLQEGDLTGYVETTTVPITIPAVPEIPGITTNMDCIWEVNELLEGIFDVTLRYVRNLEFSVNNPIQTLFNFENQIIEKTYWVDGLNQLRFINTKHSIDNGDLEELIDIKSNTINIVGEYLISQPRVNTISSGGIHTSGMIQYAYNLYRLNGAQTIISPLSEMVPLDKGLVLGGGELNEIIGASPIVEISDIDQEYTHIKVYAIKYTSLNSLPSVSIIVDKEIDNYSNFSYFDDGNSIGTITLSEFLFLGSNPFVPKHIQSKDNRLFAANIKEIPFDFEIDMRAYSFDSGGASVLRDNDGSTLNVPIPSYVVPLKHDAINNNYDIYKYQQNGTLIGGEGKFIKYNILQKTENELSKSLKYLKFFKDNEIYRLAIIFYNRFGQVSAPKWIADFIAPVGNLEGNYNTLKIEIDLVALNAYIDTLNLEENNSPIGYKIVRADRTLVDRTIICQGVISGMMCQTTRDVEAWQYWMGTSNRRKESLVLPKIPIPITRGFDNSIHPTRGTSHLLSMNEQGAGEGHDEIYRDDKEDFKRQQSWQYTKMMQMYSPEILFNSGLVFGAGLSFEARGLVKTNTTDVYYKEILTNSLSINKEKKRIDTSSVSMGTNSPAGGTIAMWGFIAPIRNEGDYDDPVTVHQQYHKSYDSFIKSPNKTVLDIYGTPEIVARGQGVTTYNKDGNFKYNNNLLALITDAHRWVGNSSKNDRGITGSNTYGCRSLIFVEGQGSEDEIDRESIEDIHASTGISETDGMLIVEIKRPSSYLELGNVYGGNTFESKSRSTYVETGIYTPITTGNVEIDSPGDTFVQNFRFARLSKSDVTSFSVTTLQFTEIVEFNVETSINLLNRNDLSLSDWDNEFQPKYDDYHDYNRVYSQNANLIQRQAQLFKFKQINEFDTRIVSSKFKVPGEFIDSWTDFLENETIDLDGEYGPINGFVNSNDEIFSLQDNAVALVRINPRIQIQSEGGIDIELGTGGILHDYQYLSTTSGTINKWSVFESNTGFYYYDALNREIFNVNKKAGIMNLGSMKGLYTFLQNNSDYEMLKVDNPLIKSGVNGIFDTITSTALFTLHQGDKTFTLSYNEKTQSFESFYDYTPSIYINKGFKLLSTDFNSTSLYEHNSGNYNQFYGVTYPSDLILQVNPQGHDSIFNNFGYKGEMYSNDVDVAKATLTHIQAYNEYQTSAVTPLIVGSNIKRKFRLWKGNIPRVLVNGNPTLDRMRGQWVKILFRFENPNNYKMVLHDMLIGYTSYRN